MLSWFCQGWKSQDKQTLKQTQNKTGGYHEDQQIRIDGINRRSSRNDIRRASAERWS